ncbi:hypothetical protein KQX54_011643 [Cotesia glomerata]|uniref:Uncharacterized protein n=1 Tax=Cotesia glomerata TaxID=32391 RepID=A0AAV7IJ17_COTGL|nr:hypothetical protein KQX54_011643 [Cotesia glomerata]
MLGKVVRSREIEKRAMDKRNRYVRTVMFAPSNMLEPNYHRTPLLRNKVVISDLCILWVLLIIYDSERSNLNKRSTKQGPDTSKSIISARGHTCPKKGNEIWQTEIHSKLLKDARKRCESDKDNRNGGQRKFLRGKAFRVGNDTHSSTRPLCHCYGPVRL